MSQHSLLKIPVVDFKMCYICLCCGTFILMIQSYVAFFYVALNAMKLWYFYLKLGVYLKHLIGLIKTEWPKARHEKEQVS